MHPTKILVIDDERPTLSMFRLFLDAYGYAVLTAESGEEGLAIFQDEQPPIVLTDVKMPGIDGLEVLSRIKAASPATEVIVITGHGDMDLAIKALNLDATDFINKPIQKKDLDNALARAGERLKLASEHRGGVALELRPAPRPLVAVVAIQGNVTSHSEAELGRAFDHALAARLPVLLSFADSASINGAGIAILTAFMRQIREAGLTMAMSGVSENFRKVFDIVGLTRLAQVYDTEAHALESLGVQEGA